MSTWTDTAQADPIADLRAWQAQAVASVGLAGDVALMSWRTLGHLIDAMRSAAALEIALRSTLRRAFIRRYRIRRRMGHSRLKIIAPPLWRLRASVRWRWVEFKHRNDPDWI